MKGYLKVRNRNQKALSYIKLCLFTSRVLHGKRLEKAGKTQPYKRQGKSLSKR
jgi:hypothetical protein